MDHTFLTYDEAAKRLGIKPDSVRRRARSRKWPRKKGNDGKARVGIPEDILSSDNPPRHPPGLPPGDPPDIEAAELRVEVKMLRERMEEIRQDRDSWKAQAERLSEPRTVVPGFFGRIFGK
jgi:hypothetical protein